MVSSQGGFQYSNNDTGETVSLLTSSLELAEENRFCSRLRLISVSRRDLTPTLKCIFVVGVITFKVDLQRRWMLPVQLFTVDTITLISGTQLALSCIIIQ